MGSSVQVCVFASEERMKSVQTKEGGIMEESGEGSRKEEGGCAGQVEEDPQEDSQNFVGPGKSDDNICNPGWESELNHIDPKEMKSKNEKSDFFFEGAEKLLEVWFTTKNKSGSECDLRNIPRAALEQMLTIAQCEIISCMSNSHVDAYVLSESSMFLSKRRIVLKTCGTTTPLDCLEKMIWLVKKFTGYDMVEDVFYSRKNFQRPDLQVSPYRFFEQEVTTLDKFFSEGAAYCMGNLSRDCWYMYTLNPMDHYANGKEYRDNDQSLEILMSELDPKIMDIFHKQNSSNAELATKKAGIDKLVPGMKIDDALFEPCGYSMNAVHQESNSESGLGEYTTIHITPEMAFSYVSFETNIPSESYMDLVTQAIDTFLPGKFIITFYATRTSVASSFHQELKKCPRIDDCRRNDIQFCSFQDCDLTYAHFFKASS